MMKIGSLLLINIAQNSDKWYFKLGLIENMKKNNNFWEKLNNPNFKHYDSKFFQNFQHI